MESLCEPTGSQRSYAPSVLGLGERRYDAEASSVIFPPWHCVRAQHRQHIEPSPPTQVGFLRGSVLCCRGGPEGISGRGSPRHRRSAASPAPVGKARLPGWWGVGRDPGGQTAPSPPPPKGPRAPGSPATTPRGSSPRRSRRWTSTPKRGAGGGQAGVTRPLKFEVWSLKFGIRGAGTADSYLDLAWICSDLSPGCVPSKGPPRGRTDPKRLNSWPHPFSAFLLFNQDPRSCPTLRGSSWRPSQTEVYDR